MFEFKIKSYVCLCPLAAAFLNKNKPKTELHRRYIWDLILEFL